MADYNLAGLNTRDFEHLIQALAIHHIASGITPYGDGPDGGREATFRGKMNYFTGASQWDGYLVMQAKFLARTSDDANRSGEWALKQLKSELDKFSSLKRNLPRPEYYIFVTNAVLTPVQDAGSKDKVFRLLDDYQQLLGLKGYDVWDFDKICRLIDGSQDIRCRFAGFISPGDVLSKVMDMLDDLQADFVHTMGVYLQKEMRAEQFVKLQQAGTTSDQKTSLAQVFVDLPVSNHQLLEPPDEDSQFLRTNDLVIEVLKSGSQILRNSVQTMNRTLERTQEHISIEPGRFVIIGGPGQGKSTIGQFICQLYRAALLNSRPAHALSAEARSVLELFNRQCAGTEIDSPLVRRFPVRIVLDQFATALANEETKSLLGYVVNSIVDATETQVSMTDLRKWLKTYPWIVVLDGLDEVPPTSNRKQVIEKITEFWSEVASLDADVLVIATTRPQGYDDDFSPKYYKHLYLTPLSQKRALHYARKLVEAQHSSDPKRQQQILKRLEVACQQDTTQRLMRSPLQVTIMATLVDTIGQPPQERWRLFRQYYEVIYRRETERDIPASRILQQRSADVNAIHYRVGLLLQTESEYAGTTDSKLPLDRFEKLVYDRIAEEGYEGAELQERTLEITEAALHRLVFLVGLEAERIGFEIRSFQEFMAAEALMDGKEDQVRARLETIAPIVHWRNVFLFATGKCFADMQYHRDMIVTICEQLNDKQTNELAGVTLSGSKLALDILEEGIVREQPKWARSLARIAVRIMEIPSADLNVQLANVHDYHLDQIFRESVELGLSQRHFYQRLGSWHVLKVLIGKGIQWAISLAEEYWPTEPQYQRLIIESRSSKEFSNWAQSRIIDLVPHLEPWRSYIAYRALNINELLDYSESDIENKALNQLPLWYRAIESTWYRRYHSSNDSVKCSFQIDQEQIEWGISYQSIYPSTKDEIIPLQGMPMRTPHWAPYIAGARFLENPSADTLSRELYWLAENCNPSISPVLLTGYIPWPLRACIQAAQTSEELREYARLAKTGHFGKTADWSLAEQRWQKQGVSLNDLVHSNTMDKHPFSSEIANIGFPFSVSSLEPADLDKSIKQAWTQTYRQYEMLDEGNTKNWFAEALLGLLSYRRIWLGKQPTNVTPSQLANLIMHSQDVPFFWNEGLTLPRSMSDEWLELVELIGNKFGPMIFAERLKINETSVKTIVKSYVKSVDRIGLLRFLGSLAMLGMHIPIANEYIHPDEYEDKKTILAKVAIRISKGEWTTSEASQVAIQIKNIRDYLPLLRRLNHTLGSTKVPITDHKLLFLELHKLISDMSVDQVIGVYDSLHAVMRVTTSQLTRPDVWKELSLPNLLG